MEGHRTGHPQAGPLRRGAPSPGPSIGGTGTGAAPVIAQIAKDLALKISSIGYPEPNGLAQTKDIKKLNKYKDNKERLNKSIERALITDFGYIKENDSDDLGCEQLLIEIPPSPLKRKRLFSKCFYRHV